MATNYIPKIIYGTGPTTITFDYPPKGDPFGEEFQSVGKVSETKGGAQQNIVDFIKVLNSLTWGFVSSPLKTSLDTFFQTHALLGKEFDYYFDKDDVATKITVKMDKSGMRPKWKVITRKGAGFLYETKVKFRRVI